MDGDTTAKTFTEGANSAKNTIDLTDSVHEAAHQPVGLPAEQVCSNGVLTQPRPQQARRPPALARACSPRTELLATCSKVRLTLEIGNHSLCSKSVLLTILRAVADGPIGGTAQSIGGPLDKEGMIGKHFTEHGAIGGTVQENLANKKST